MKMNSTITKIVKESDTPEGSKADQVVSCVEVKNEWYCGTEQQYKEEQETTERLESNTKQKKVAMKHQFYKA